MFPLPVDLSSVFEPRWPSLFPTFACVQSSKTSAVAHAHGDLAKDAKDLHKQHQKSVAAEKAVSSHPSPSDKCSIESACHSTVSAAVFFVPVPIRTEATHASREVMTCYAAFGLEENEFEDHCGHHCAE